jgi:hypothetical protein
MVAASIAVGPGPLPRTQIRRGVRGRSAVVDYFNPQIPLGAKGAATICVFPSSAERPGKTDRICRTPTSSIT